MCLLENCKTSPRKSGGIPFKFSGHILKIPRVGGQSDT